MLSWFTQAIGDENFNDNDKNRKVPTQLTESLHRTVIFESVLRLIKYACGFFSM
jgi:hypothetical protein